MTSTLENESKEANTLKNGQPRPVKVELFSSERRRPPKKAGMEQHFGPTDPKIDALKLPVIGKPLTKLFKSRPFQFMMILPNQAIFWIVIIGGIIGGSYAMPAGENNFGTVITWFIWFCLIFIMIVGVGRAWCMMCPFGGFAEWVQRHTFWKRTIKPITANWKWPEKMAKFGILPAVGTFIFLTWIEEFFNIAGPGYPIFTSLMVLGIVATALTVMLLFERRTFCRYLCPLTGLIGSAGATGMVAGFRTRDRDKCLACQTKDCMRGSEKGYGCPWFEWPGSASSNLMCGLCTECMKNCPEDNVGLFLQPPLTSVIKPDRRRTDVGIAVVALLGLVVFQQFNALSPYQSLDNWLNSHTGFQFGAYGYPNPIDYLGIIALAALVPLLLTGIITLLVAKKTTTQVTETKDSGPRVVPSSGGVALLEAPVAQSTTKTVKTSQFKTWFVALAYGIIPLMASDYLARQLPKFLSNSPRIIAAISDPFDKGWNLFGTAKLHIANQHILLGNGVVVVQMVVVGIGLLASLYATNKIVKNELVQVSKNALATRAITLLYVLALGVAVGGLYYPMHAAF